jgi:hypothetical protein
MHANCHEVTLSQQAADFHGIEAKPMNLIAERARGSDKPGEELQHEYIETITPYRHNLLRPI